MSVTQAIDGIVHPQQQQRCLLKRAGINLLILVTRNTADYHLQQQCVRAAIYLRDLKTSCGKTGKELREICSHKPSTIPEIFRSIQECHNSQMF